MLAIEYSHSQQSQDILSCGISIIPGRRKFCYQFKIMEVLLGSHICFQKRKLLRISFISYYRTNSQTGHFRILTGYDHSGIQVDFRCSEDMEGNFNRVVRD